MVIVQVIYKNGYTCGSGWRTGEMLIKHLIDVQLPFPFISLPPSLLLFILSSTSSRGHGYGIWESGEVLKLLSWSGQSPSAN